MLYGSKGMSIYKLLENAINKWGSTFKITQNGETINCKGFIQPLRYKNNMYLNGKSLDAGYFDGGHFLFISYGDIGLVNHKVAYFEDTTSKYVVKRADVHTYKDNTLYTWAILKPYFPPVEEDCTDE